MANDNKLHPDHLYNTCVCLCIIRRGSTIMVQTNKQSEQIKKLSFSVSYMLHSFVHMRAVFAVVFVERISNIMVMCNVEHNKQ